MYHFLLPPPSNSVMSVMKRIPYSKSNMDQNWFFGGLRKPQPSIIKRKKRIMLVSKNGKIQNNQTNEQSRIINSNTFQPTILIPTINSLVVNVQYSVSHCLEHRDYLVV